jgi:predicted amidohydrolase/Flp pilus assembly protein TadD
VWFSVGGVIAMIVVTYGYGIWRASGLVVEDGPRIAVVQPNVRHTIRNIRGVHLMQLLMTLDEVPRGAADLIVWPENAIMDDLARGGSYLEDLRWLAEQKDAAMLVGALGVRQDHPGRTTNSAFLMTKEGRIVGEYAKSVLFGWTEYIPQDRLLERLSTRLHRMHRAIARISWGFLPTGLAGEGAVRLELPSDSGPIPFGALICVENAYPPLPADNRRKGARFLVNLTSEGDVGGPVQEQLLRISIFRSVENRVGYVRAANTGISGFIDPVGRVQGLVIGDNGATIGVAGVKIDTVGVVDEGPTVYARSRDAFAKGCVVAGLLLWGATWWRRKPGAAAVVAAIVLGSAGCAGVPQIGSDVEGAQGALEEGLRLYDEGRHREALHALVAACADPTPCRQALRPTAACFIKTFQPENGADYFAAVEHRHPQLAAEAARYRGYMFEKSLMARRAEEAYGESLAHAPTAETFELLGIQRVRNGDVHGGIEAFREGIRAVSRPTRLHARLGRALLEAGQAEEARIELDTALREDPRDVSAWITRGRIYAALGQQTAATAALRRAIALDDSSIEARFQLARFALRAGNDQEARRLLGKISTIEATLGRGPREEE